jgi:hypothetical protein
MDKEAKEIEDKASNIAAKQVAERMKSNSFYRSGNYVNHRYNNYRGRG